MKIVIAPQEFKGSISALDVSKAAKKGILKVFPKAEVIMCPVADGGDGTLETLVEISGGSKKQCSVYDPLGKEINTEWGGMGDNKTAVIEMARMCGLALLELNQRDPLRATTFGLGQTITNALDQGFRKFIIGIGGSATNDGGAGMAQALGADILDKDGTQLPWGGAALSKVASIDISKIDERVSESEFLVACDVTNPLTGPEGASAVYGPQKGANPEMIVELDAALNNLANVIKKDLNKEVSQHAGSGAAGGLGAGIMAFLDGQLKAGVDIVLDTVNIIETLKGADLVITGEGAMDFQTVYNKAPIGVAKRASQLGIPTIGICGMLGKDYQVVHENGIDAAISITNGPMSLSESSMNAHKLVEECVEESARLIKIGSRLSS